MDSTFKLGDIIFSKPAYVKNANFECCKLVNYHNDDLYRAYFFKYPDSKLNPWYVFKWDCIEANYLVRLIYGAEDDIL